MIDSFRQYIISRMESLHWSDCAIYNEPAEPKGPCDCGGAKAEQRLLSCASRFVHIWASYWKIRLEAWLKKLFYREKKSASHLKSDYEKHDRL